MALKWVDRTKETTTTTGTGDITLAGAQTGYQAFSAGLSDADTFYYTIADQSGGNWEVGLGTYHSAGNTFTRTTVLASSNGGAAVSFTAGTKDVFLDLPADRVSHTPFTDLANTFTVGPQTFNGSSPTSSAWDSGTLSERFGAGAGGSATTGGSNCCFGHQAGNSLTSGQFNCFFGDRAGKPCTTGSDNVGIGFLALFSLTTANSNMAQGASALTNCTSGNDNTGIGTGALFGCTTGAGNSCIGSSAGYPVTTGQFNVAIGYTTFQPSQAGAVNLTTGNFNIAIGYSAATATNNQQHGIAIGAYSIAAANEFGVGPYLTQQTWWGNSSVQGRRLIGIQYSFPVSTDATYTAQGKLVGFDSNNLSAGREAYRWQTDGTQILMSWFAVAAVAQQANASQAAITAVTDANAKSALQAIYNLLKNYGLAPATA